MPPPADKTKDKVTEDILNYLPDPYKGKDGGKNTFGLMTAYATHLKKAYDSNDELIIQVFIDTCTGEFLDDLGRLYKLLRKAGETDDPFRGRIKSARTSFLGSGTALGIKNAIVGVTGITIGDITITDIADLKFLCNVNLPTPEQQLLKQEVIDTVFTAKAAGVWPIITFDVEAQEAILAVDNVLIFPTPIYGIFTVEASGIDGSAILV